MNQIKLPLISERKITKELSGRQYEDIVLIEDLEKNILKRRDYVVSPIKKNENVILLLSGGLDSVVTWNLLLKHFQANVYPLYVSRIFNPGEELSIRYYQSIFKRLPGFHNFYRYNLSNKLFRFNSQLDLVPPELILKSYASKMQEVLNPFSGWSQLVVLLAGYYRMRLWWNHNIKINKIISAVTAEDGIEVQTQTQTFARQIMLTLMLMFSDSELEYYSLGLEKNLQFFIKKEGFVKLGAKLGLNLSFTHSCHNNKFVNCGQCPACKYRKNLFAKNHISDKTFYLHN